MEQTPGANTEQKTVLVVDDDPDALGFMSQCLLNARYSVLTATGGQQALEKSDAYAPPIDLLLTDFQMPGMSGIDLATAISARRPEIKVLMISGFASGLLVLNEGWHFLAKPFIPSQLLALISELISPDKPSRYLEPRDSHHSE